MLLFLLYQVAEITFNFWYKLSEVLYRKNSDSVNEQFKPYVERLIEALYRHCQIEPDHVSLLLIVAEQYMRLKISLGPDSVGINTPSCSSLGA